MYYVREQCGSNDNVGFQFPFNSLPEPARSLFMCPTAMLAVLIK